MEVIKDFLYKLGNDYLYWTLAIIIALVILIFLCIVLHEYKKRTKAEKSKEKFKQSALQSLTPEEIDNISNNSANPKEVKEYLTAEVVIPTEKVATKTQKGKSAKTSSKKKTQTNDKKEEKPTQTKTVKKAETKKELARAETKTETKNTKNTAQTKKQTATKPATTTQKPVEQENEKRRYTGKWKISQEDEGYIATLTASNGGTLLKTEKYKSISGVKNGIETIKKNIDVGNFAISVDKYGHYRFKLFNVSNRLICVSEDYSSKNKCENGIESVKRFAKTDTVIIEEK